MSCETEPTCRIWPAASPLRNSTVYEKLFMRGSKPGRSPLDALTFVAFVSVITALPLPSIVTGPTLPSASGRFVSSGSISGPLSGVAGMSAEPPSIVTGPRIWLTVFGIGGKTRASVPSTVKSGRPWTRIDWATSQFEESNTICGVTTAPPRLSGLIAIDAETPAVVREEIVITRPATETL